LNNICKKMLVIGIIFLFVGVSIPSTGNASEHSTILKFNNPPYVPINPIPPNGSTNVTTMVYLCWTGGDPDGDEVFYNVYFGNTSPPPGYLYNQSNNCTPVLYLLEFNTTYYWKIISIDEHGASTEGPIWSFNTMRYPGKTLYVGGSGPNNYTSIQDAIDNASDGYKVFVYDDSSPYYENVVVNKSISLVGEDKDTTVIDGIESGDVVYISADWVNINGFTIQNSRWDAAGIKIFSNHTIITGNTITSNNGNGISLRNSSGNNIIIGNNISKNDYGILLYGSNGNILTGNNITNNSWDGIHLEDSSSNNITGNNISNNGFNGIMLGYSNNIITDNNISSNHEFGILLIGFGNIVTGNNISNNGVGIHFYYSSNNNTITGNNINSNNWYGIHLDMDSYDNTITGNNINSNNWYGMYLCKSNGNIIKGNNITSSHYNGIWLYKSNGNNNITGNNISSNHYYGISLSMSSGNNIMENNISNNNCGISLGGSNNNIVGNDISNNNDAIYLSCSSNNTFTGNTISNNEGSIDIIDGSSGNTFTGNTISNNEGSILLWSSTNNLITGNNISNNRGSGINLGNSSVNSITDNNISNNNYGINLYMSSGNNTIIGNSISLNKKSGIALKDSSNNNTIYHNNFINNTQNANDECDNTWDDGKYGNYWSDYEEKYPDAKKKRWKSIWDTPYEIEGGYNKDNYPLINQYPKSVIKSKSTDKSFNYNFPIISWLFEQFSNVFTLIKYLLNPYDI